MSDNEVYFLQKEEQRFGIFQDDPNDLHLQYREEKTHYELTETQYFAFSIPEESIHSLLYLWHHPNLGTVSGGYAVFQGIKVDPLSAELIDYRSFMSDDVLKSGLGSYRLDNGYQVEALEPGRVFRLRADDPGSDSGFDVTLNAISEPMIWPSGNHFEQVMRTTGELRLHGEKYKVDGYNVRNRSWGEYRSEVPANAPPNQWMTGVFDDNFSFNVTCFDHPDLDPLWKGKYSVNGDDALKFGWVIVDGAPAIVKDARKVTRYDRRTLYPQSIEMRLVDSRDRVFDINGTVVAAWPFAAWQNIRCPICLTRWECNGRIGWGDTQDVQWRQFVRDFL